MNYILPLILLIPTANLTEATTPEKEYTKPIKLDASASMTYEDILNEAVFNCRFTDSDKVDYELLDKLIAVEKKYNPPAELKGLILAAACQESGYNPNALGDRKFSKNGKTPMAVGLFQMWPWWEKKSHGYGIDRRNPVEAADAWMRHITKQIKFIKRTCKYRTDKRIWIAAWVRAIRYPTKNNRCRQVPKHYRLLKKWHKNIIKQKKECEINGCGC